MAKRRAAKAAPAPTTKLSGNMAMDKAKRGGKTGNTPLKMAYKKTVTKNKY